VACSNFAAAPASSSSGLSSNWVMLAVFAGLAALLWMEP
jgi:hypothetical protein